ncbi:PREDICTED: GRIP and coiled-coil domain-containing protein 1 [Ceratosolen solmsi marchali]|uniref:GRIP and coiled-coil domain-containing protein 1 n=1 Tax=Ceratosolen solmsi marchali TaxID=326594 RepID=A0AAJ7DWC6_9HYME|nr:PREDICTED: GRIP and coiled-coil domain-containing protein 1 [Ceratosolen solmsi marchali]
MSFKMVKNANMQNETRSNQRDLQNELHDLKVDEQSAGIQEKEPKMQSSNMLDKTNSEDTVQGLKNQLETLMNSLAVLSTEKSRMEANFQTEKKQIRSEREEHERVTKNLKEKLKRIQGHATSEVEHLKYKLIMERHEREKEQSEHAASIKELHKKIHNEQRVRDQLEVQLKELKFLMPSKSQNRILEAELDVVKNKLKQAEAAVNEAPTTLLKLQSEMSTMKKRHKAAILEEQKKLTAAEQEMRSLSASHESRVAGLEGRLAELSDIVGGYDRLRQEDQKTIYKLKDQLIVLQNNNKQSTDQTSHELAEKIKSFYFELVELDKGSSCSNVKDLLNSLKLCDNSEAFSYKEKYETVIKEFEEYKERFAANEVRYQNHENGISNDEMQLHRAKSHNKNLEEKLRMLVAELSEKERDFKVRLEKEQQQMQEQFAKTESLLVKKDIELKNKIDNLEQQLLKQRERSLIVIQEKDKEIRILKSSFDALLPKKNALDTVNQKFHLPMRHIKTEVTDLVSGLLTTDNNPPMIHYTQELARKEVQVSSLRKQTVQMEIALRDLERNSFHTAEKHEEEIKKLTTQIKRLEASKSREGANLEYLKNVFINYLTSDDAAGKCHMLNAISTVLQFTIEEVDKISKYKR